DVKKEEFIEFGYLVFEGPLNLTIEFNKYNNIDIWDPSYLYSLWYQYGSDLQNEWRKYFYTVVHCFGGDRVIYIPEAFSSSAISTKYEYYEGTFDELENELKKDFGDSKKRLSELSYEQYDDYFIDMLDDIDWDYNAPMD
ncbi:MAG: hypothetical protein LBH07_06125, partial [Treponema sp.]|nr:hypothetical protein [Treponema sp.]